MSKITMTIDGNTAAAYVAYAYTEVAAIYPITPSSAMAEVVDDWAAAGRENIFGQTVKVVEMQSEAGAAGAFHGALQAGALTTTFTASQGLLLMIPNMYKTAGELLPGVFHVSARSIAAQALSIFGDHQDVMAVRQTGCVMLASSSVQEVMDMAIVAHLSAVKGRLPFVHFFDGFRTSHEIQRVEALEYEDLKNLMDMEALKKFKANSLSPNHPVMRGTAQNPDIYFQMREAANPFYDNIIPIVEDYMNKVSSLTGREYRFFQYYGASDAEYIIVAIGSVCETIEETIDECNDKGEKYGLVKVHLFRPFSAKHFLNEIPDTVKCVTALDRTKEPGAMGEPLFLDVVSCFYGQEKKPRIIGGRYGLGSKDTTPSQICAVFENMKTDEPKEHFTVGINDDVTGTSLEVRNELSVAKKDTVQCKFWGLGSDGTVGANKQAIKIIGQHAGKFVQGYFSYDSKKSGGLTVSHLRFGDSPIKSAYLIEEADYIACHNQSFLNCGYDLLHGLKQGGIFLLNCIYEENEIEKRIPHRLLKELADKNAKFYCINAVKIAEEIGLGNRINMVMQAAFFKLTKIIPQEKAKEYLYEAIKKAYGRKGEQIVLKNYQAVEQGFVQLREIRVKPEWKNFETEEKNEAVEPEFVEKILRPMERADGDKLPVSTFSGMEDGTFPVGATAYEKRGVAINVPEWIEKNCIQCNQCSYICPHACIRPVLLDEKEKQQAPDSFVTKEAVGKGLEGLHYRMQLSPMDCTGCGNCADICPAKEKALVMQKMDTQAGTQAENWKYAVTKVAYKGDRVEGTTVKDSQFKQPLIEYSGACAGCGETPYIKLVTQLFGERMMIANATGCSSIWAASAPSMAYTCTADGKGPAWANSLFEDNAEYGYGMYIGVEQIRDGIKQQMKNLIESGISKEAEDAFKHWIEVKDEAQASYEAAKEVRSMLDKLENSCESPDKLSVVKELKNKADYLEKRSQWIVGGDGWAYDIGFGGLDHVIASGADVNILIFDTEIYSNTGGQASKSTPAAAVAKFASAGKRAGKKDLGRMMMGYGNVYVAQVAMGADKNQTLKAILEAEKYHGPSIIIAYAPCISHGIKEGMGRSMANMQQAVDSGYWHLYRYNPQLAKEGKNPFILDSKEPKADFKQFLMGQVRYASLAAAYPELAQELFEKTQQDAERRLEYYRLCAKGEII